MAKKEGLMVAHAAGGTAIPDRAGCGEGTVWALSSPRKDRSSASGAFSHGISIYRWLTGILDSLPLLLA